MVMKKKITILLWLLGVLMACVRETGIPVGENSFAKEAYRPEITLSAIDSILHHRRPENWLHTLK